MPGLDREATAMARFDVDRHARELLGESLVDIEKG